ncbi:hypothetical protein FD755_019797, partial [Muntiacus reevesi]
SGHRLGLLILEWVAISSPEDLPNAEIEPAPPQMSIQPKHWPSLQNILSTTSSGLLGLLSLSNSCLVPLLLFNIYFLLFGCPGSLEGTDNDTDYFHHCKDPSHGLEKLIDLMHSCHKPSICKKHFICKTNASLYWEGIPSLQVCFQICALSFQLFLIEFPRTVHFNILLSFIDVNIEICTCRKDMVKISMDIFVRKFQPDRYQLWKQGKDIYTIDHTKPTPESTPEIKAWLQRRRKVRKASRSFQCTSSHSKRPKNEEDEKLSATVGGTEGPTPDPDPYDLKDDGKPEEAVKLANTEAPSEKETSVSRMQLDHNLSDNIRFSGNVCLNTSVAEKIKAEDDQTCAAIPPSNPSEADESISSDQVTSEESEPRKLPWPKSPESFSSVAESSSALTEGEESDVESRGSGLEPGEVPAVSSGKRNGFKVPSPDSSNEENDSRWETKLDEVVTSGGKTKPLIPEMCFIYSEENIEYSPPNAFLEEDGTSLLISCAKCRVRVHASCYGIPSHEICDGWLCARCKRNAWTAVSGLFIPSIVGPWAHVMCAVAVPEVRFTNVPERTQIDVGRIPLQRLKLVSANTFFFPLINYLNYLSVRILFLLCCKCAYSFLRLMSSVRQRNTAFHEFMLLVQALNISYIMRIFPKGKLHDFKMLKHVLQLENMWPFLGPMIAVGRYEIICLDQSVVMEFEYKHFNTSKFEKLVQKKEKIQ